MAWSNLLISIWTWTSPLMFWAYPIFQAHLCLIEGGRFSQKIVCWAMPFTGIHLLCQWHDALASVARMGWLKQRWEISPIYGSLLKWGYPRSSIFIEGFKSDLHECSSLFAWICCIFYISFLFRPWVSLFLYGCPAILHEYLFFCVNYFDVFQPGFVASVASVAFVDGFFLVYHSLLVYLYVYLSI